ncbi:MAG: DUF2905 domain-containing protein [Bryobacteraceae bacterium]
MGLGRMLIYLGVVLAVAGVLITILPLRFGRLPGDIVIRGRNSTFYFPLATCILLSVALTLIFWIFRR